MQRNNTILKQRVIYLLMIGNLFTSKTRLAKFNSQTTMIHLKSMDFTIEMMIYLYTQTEWQFGEFGCI